TPWIWQGISALWYGYQHGGIGAIHWAGLGHYLLPAVLMSFTTGPLGEEVGWRGYLLPGMLTRYGAVPAGPFRGFLWVIWHVPLYVKSVFSTFETGAAFTLHTMCSGVIMTVLWAFTNGSVFWAIIFHYTVNITPGVIQAMFPGMQRNPANVDYLDVTV